MITITFNKIDIWNPDLYTVSKNRTDTCIGCALKEEGRDCDKGKDLKLYRELSKRFGRCGTIGRTFIWKKDLK